MLMTIREAAEATGHSPHRIRRLIKAIADQPTHADRSEVEPSSADVERLNAEGVQFTWRISEDLVRREFGETLPPSAGSKSADGAVFGESVDFPIMLQRVLDAKQQSETRLFEQLRVKDEQIVALNDRLRESNLLMASLQRQLPAPQETRPEPLRPSTTSSATGRKAKPVAAAKPPPRRSWLPKMFR